MCPTPSISAPSNMGTRRSTPFRQDRPFSNLVVVRFFRHTIEFVNEPLRIDRPTRGGRSLDPPVPIRPAGQHHVHRRARTDSDRSDTVPPAFRVSTRVDRPLLVRL